MTEKISKEADSKVYEIGYLLVSSIPGEKVAETTATLKGILADKGANFLGEGAPELQPLAYTMIKKIGSQNHRFDEAYFGWFKFELQSGEIESVKKSFELHADVLRMLLITTIKENTFLGKKASVPQIVKSLEAVGEVPAPAPEAVASIEDIDKSIDEMVKEA